MAVPIFVGHNARFFDPPKGKRAVAGKSARRNPAKELFMPPPEQVPSNEAVLDCSIGFGLPNLMFRHLLPIQLNSMPWNIPRVRESVFDLHWLQQKFVDAKCMNLQQRRVGNRG